MSRFAVSIVVALLTFSASGLSGVVIAEPCTGYEQPSQDDGACPPTCVTCGCCSQTVEPVILFIASSPESPIAQLDALISRLPKTRAREILHVPKPRLA
jgi:hypothetical protein